MFFFADFGEHGGRREVQQADGGGERVHVNCTEDAAAFVALVVIVDLSMDACRLLSQQLRKELRQQFKWLSRCLDPQCGGGESAKSDRGDSAEEEKLEMVCLVCQDFNAATMMAMNVHIDGCLAQAVREEQRQIRRTG
ncbi:hypothetical protein Fmac_008846 [Flemingia macrophylla]|uniref:Zinc finger protein n=1 Tax=Flemingia macrophylla TaxID=520843 RepID=A0ABD1MZ34_9FABA